MITKPHTPDIRRRSLILFISLLGLGGNVLAAGKNLLQRWHLSFSQVAVDTIPTCTTLSARCPNVIA
ncbi:MAG: hypothetical protein IPH37_14650 [Burkholderiales bacterium]|nr:hypothetical protein [Burkholderiales bacterium]